MNRKERRAAGRQSGGEIGSLLAAAVRHHQGGELVQAEACYRGVLARDPRHARALYYLGILAAQTRRHDAAIDLIGRAAALDPRNAELQYNLAAAFQGAGRLDDAIAGYGKAIALDPAYIDAHMNLGNALAELGRAAEAVACYDRVLALDPASAAAHYNAANVLARAGDLTAAIARFGEALRLRPDLAEAHNNLGNALKSADRADEAEAAYRRALALRPDYADAHNNLGTALMLRGATEEAAGHYRGALQAKPDFAEAHNNLGLALFRQGRPEEAVAQFEKALALNPRYLDAYLNLARQLYALGDAPQAIAVAARALDVKATPDTRNLLARYAGALTDAGQAEPYRAAIDQALREGWTRSSELEHVAMLLIRRNPAVARALARCGEPDCDALAPDDLAAISTDRLLGSLMITARVAAPDLQRLLMLARRALLAAAEHAPDILPDELAFACALARQCFINEYILAETAQERAGVRRLVDVIGKRLQAGGDIPPLWPAVVAAHSPLHAIPEMGTLADRTWPAPLAAVLVQQIAEPREEQEIRASLPALTPIGEGVSRQVQEQYEENPYPSWVTPAPALTAYPAGEYFRMKFPLAPLRPLRLAGGADVLIAGCGTGAHAIETSRKIAGARVLAIDLSGRSLAYAIRKTRPLGLAIEYAQADIMRLGGIGRTFDVIESSGVLHHLADPMAGWRILLSLLRPGGVMSVGLYSRLARAEINAARAFIAERGYRPTADDIRRCRAELLALPEGAPGRAVTQSGDFYSMSECRDLLFHVQEHQHTLPEIAAFLAEQNLQFLGFDLDARVLNLYGQTHPDDPAMVDLARWHDFECRNPGVFVGMYQFAVQRR
jgi:tetratricopeptide (TPR) repeat protein/SAM-dependent methyltransferase